MRITGSGKPLNPNCASGGAHETHEPPGRERHLIESNNVSSLASRTNGQDGASAEWHPVEDSHGPAQLPNATKKDPTSGQQELERLSASVRSVQREEAAARLPRAAQLPPVLGLTPVDNGSWPPRLPEPQDLAVSPETLRTNLRGPRTIIKVIVLIVGIFAVPVAYYFWAGGWDPISNHSPEMMSFASQFIPTPTESSSQQEMIVARDVGPGAPTKRDMPSDRVKSPSRFRMATPKSSSQEETIVARDLGPGSQNETTVTQDHSLGVSAKGDMPSDRAKSPARFSMSSPKSSSQEETTTAQDHKPGGTLAKEEMPSDYSKLQPAAKSFPGETVAKLEPGVPGDQSPPPSAAVRTLDSKEIKLLMEQGERFIAVGDVVPARIAFQRAAEAGDADAAVALGATYDPSVLAKLGVVGISADIVRARSWYKRAEKLGSPDARSRFDALADR